MTKGAYLWNVWAHEFREWPHGGETDATAIFSFLALIADPHKAMTGGVLLRIIAFLKKARSWMKTTHLINLKPSNFAMLAKSIDGNRKGAIKKPNGPAHLRRAVLAINTELNSDRLLRFDATIHSVR